MKRKFKLYNKEDMFKRNVLKYLLLFFSFNINENLFKVK